ncbi:MAG: 4Fe-4S binding protein [Bacillota bacterium]
MAKAKKKWYQKVSFYRYLTQGIVFLFILRFYLRHVLYMEGNVEEFCPFGGLETLFSYATTGTYLKQTSALNLALFGTLIFLTLLFRNGFCGWLCPIGTAQEIIRAGGKGVGGLPILKNINKNYHKFLKKHQTTLHAIDLQARKLKYLALFIVVAATWFTADLVIRDYDLIVALIRILAFPLTIGLAILVLTVALSLFMDRPFCKYFCVMGATINLVGKLSPLRIVKNEEKCIHCSLCNKACPMKIDLCQSNKIDAIDCNHCFKCIDACPYEDGLSLAYLPSEIYRLPQKTTNERLGG